MKSDAFAFGASDLHFYATMARCSTVSPLLSCVTRELDTPSQLIANFSASAASAAPCCKLPEATDRALFSGCFAAGLGSNRHAIAATLCFRVRLISF